jgi:hypothetical protein
MNTTNPMQAPARRGQSANDWHWQPAGAEQPGVIVPRIPRWRPLTGQQAAAPVAATLRQQRFAHLAPQCLAQRGRSDAGDMLRGGLVGAAIALIVVIAFHLWSA